MGRKFFLIALFGLALLVIAVLCTLRHRSAIEAGVEARANGALAAAGQAGIVAKAVNGRDIRLAGTVADDAAIERAMTAVGEVDGVRRVANFMTINPTPTGGRFRLTVADDSLTLSGTVADRAAADRLVRSAREMFPDRSVIDDLTIDPRARSGADPGFEGLIRAFDPETVPGGLEWTSDGLVVTGVVASESQREAHGRRLAGLFAGTAILNRLEVAPQPALDEVLTLKRVEFETGSARLTSRGMRTLDRVAAVLDEWPAVAIEISGHTDATGDPAFNIELSRRRAEAARTYLAQTVTADRMTAVGFGSERPIADNNTADGRLQNRRIEFRVMGESGQ